MARNLGLRNKFLLKFVSRGAEFSHYLQKCVLNMQVGSLELEKCLKEWVSGAKKWPDKRGLEGGLYGIFFFFNRMSRLGKPFPFAVYFEVL